MAGADFISQQKGFKAAGADLASCEGVDHGTLIEWGKAREIRSRKMTITVLQMTRDQ